MKSITTNIQQYLPNTSFINRTDEMARIKDYLAKSDYNLITLTGIGGIGKTRLALESAKHSSVPVCFLPLNQMNSSEEFVEAIIDVLLIDSLEDDPDATLLNYLSDKQLLLILDNFEYLLDSAHIIESIIRSSPNVKLLVTSREPLNLQAEWQIHVSGLSYPHDGKPTDDMSSVKLFVDRARSVKADFNLDKEKDDIYAICELVQGMPLAIEIAARWVKFQSCKHIRENLLNLENMLQNVPDRHRTIRTIFAQSWQCLSEKQRQLFQKLLIFESCFTAEAAFNMITIELHELAALVDKSMLQRTSDNHYYFHEMMRCFVQDNLKNAQSLKEKVNQELSEPLTPREMEVLSLLANGLSDREIATQLHISPGTVRNPHMINIRQKLNAKNRTEAVLIAKEYGLITKTTTQNQQLLGDRPDVFRLLSNV